jgi:hypothetical protein
MSSEQCGLGVGWEDLDWEEPWQPYEEIWVYPVGIL